MSIDVNDVYKRATLWVASSEQAKPMPAEQRVNGMLEDEELSEEIIEVVNKLYLKYLPENIGEFILSLLAFGILIGREQTAQQVKLWGLDKPGPKDLGNSP